MRRSWATGRASRAAGAGQCSPQHSRHYIAGFISVASTASCISCRRCCRPRRLHVKLLVFRAKDARFELRAHCRLRRQISRLFCVAAQRAQRSRGAPRTVWVNRPRQFGNVPGMLEDCSAWLLDCVFCAAYPRQGPLGGERPAAAISETAPPPALPTPRPGTIASRRGGRRTRGSAGLPMGYAIPHHQNMGTRRSRAAALRNWSICDFPVVLSRPAQRPAQ